MSDCNQAFIEKNIETIRKKMESFPDATLMAVIKNRSCEEIKCAIDCGISYMGENHAQEFVAHLPCLDGVRTDFIGALQSNKVKYLVGRINVIESVSTMSSVKEIVKLNKKSGIRTKIMVEVNTGKEEQKSGIMPDDLSVFLDTVSGEETIDILGLMAVAPVTEKSEDKKKYFSLLRKHRIFQRI